VGKNLKCINKTRKIEAKVRNNFKMRKIKTSRKKEKKLLGSREILLSDGTKKLRIIFTEYKLEKLAST